jgi:hypothetical protein
MFHIHSAFLCTIMVCNIPVCAQLSQRPVVGNVHRELFELAMQALSRICISPTAAQPLGLRVLRSRLLRGVQMMLQVPQCMSYLLSENCAAQRQALLQLSVSSPPPPCFRKSALSNRTCMALSEACTFCWHEALFFLSPQPLLTRTSPCMQAHHDMHNLG